MNWDSVTVVPPGAGHMLFPLIKALWASVETSFTAPSSSDSQAAASGKTALDFVTDRLWWMMLNEELALEDAGLEADGGFQMREMVLDEEFVNVKVLMLS